MTSVRPLADPDRDGTLFLRDLAEPIEAPPPPGATLRAATSDDRPALEAAMHASGEYIDDVVGMRFHDKRYPYVVETDGLIASYGWIAYSPEPQGDLGITFRLKPGEVYIYDCATRPDYRGRGYYPALLRFICAQLHDAGYRRAWIGTAPGNFVSQRGIARAGFLKAADVSFTRRPDGSFRIDLYGVPGVPSSTLADAAWFFYGRAHEGAGIAAQVESRK